MSRSVLLSALFALVLGAGLLVSPSYAQDRRDFDLVNGSPAITITHVYVSPSNDRNWGEDILGRDVLDPGETVHIFFARNDAPGQCMYDIRVLGKDNSEGILT